MPLVLPLPVEGAGSGGFAAFVAHVDKFTGDYALRVVGRAQIDGEAHKPRNNVCRAGLGGDLADGPDQVRRFRTQPLDGEDEVGRCQEG